VARRGTRNLSTDEETDSPDPGGRISRAAAVQYS